MKNELKIEIPRGMEIDLEKSVLTGNEPVIRFKEKSLKYEDIEKALTNTQAQLEKLSAIHNLMNIAEYYNAKSGKEIDWKDMEQCKYHIYFITNYYQVGSIKVNNYGSVYFLKKEDAQAVIDNPNFRDILDAIFKG